MADLIERLRAVEWEEIDDGDRTPDDPTHKCVFVDMRPDDFRALLREAADALEAAREDVCVLRRDNELLVEALRSLAANWDERGNTVLRQARDADESEVSRYHITAGALAGCAHELRAAIDQALEERDALAHGDEE